MKFPVLASFIIFLFWFAYEMFKHRYDQYKIDNEFWKKEAAANRTWTVPLDSLPYIQIPLEELPFEILPEDDKIKDAQDMIRGLSTKKILNLTGISNTDLKLQYGADNLEILTDYDCNFTFLARALAKWGERLVELGFVSQAKFVLEYAISIKTDISTCYYLLADIYHKEGDFDKIQTLITSAEGLDSLLKKTLVHKLKKFDR